MRKPPHFDGIAREPSPVQDVTGARVLAKLGDSVTTDHISPAGAIKTDSPAGAYLAEHGVERRDFNSYGSRRGNHEVMNRGTFANIRLQGVRVPGRREIGRPNATALLGVRAVIAESYERIHRSNLIGMGVLPLQYPDGETADYLGLTGEEEFEIAGVEAIKDGTTPRDVTVRAGDIEFQARLRIDTPGKRLTSATAASGSMSYEARSTAAPVRSGMSSR